MELFSHLATPSSTSQPTKILPAISIPTLERLTDQNSTCQEAPQLIDFHKPGELEKPGKIPYKVESFLKDMLVM